MFQLKVKITNDISCKNNYLVKIDLKFLKDCITNISKHIIQSKNQEDIVPAYLFLNHNLSILVGDGHGGKQTKKIIDNNQHLILNKIESEKSESAMIFCQQIVSKCLDGAVLSLGKIYFDKDHLVLDWSSRGDISLLIYQDQKLIHTNQIHKLDDDHNNNIVDESFLKSIDCNIRNDDQYDFKINLEGTHIITPVGSKRKYYSFPGDGDIACFGHIGHQNSSKEVPSFNKYYYLDKNKCYKFIICTDGVIDVFNIEDKILKTKNAFEICQESNKRWNQLWYIYDNRDKSRGKIFGPGRYLSSDPDDCSCITFEYNPNL